MTLPSVSFYPSEREDVIQLANEYSGYKLGGGGLPYKPIRDLPFFRVSFFSINSLTGYEN